jgi:hypothetical protein
MFVVQHGAKVKDQITGFDGHVTGRADYITGCNQILVQPRTNKEGAYVEGRWFDEHRLVVIAGESIALPEPPPALGGAAGQAPTK